MRHGPDRGALLALVAGVLLCRLPVVGAGAWRLLAPIPGSRPGGICGFVVDAKGTPWVMARGHVYWWDGKAWVQAKDDSGAYRSGYYLARFVGGPDRGAFMTQQGREDGRGSVFRLEAGRVEPVAPFYYESTDYAGLYASRSGDLFNFTSCFLAAWKDGAWKRALTPMGKATRRMSIADFGPDGPVVFVPCDVGTAILWDGAEFHPGLALPELGGDKAKGIGACRWGNNRILFWRDGTNHLAAAELVRRRLRAVDVRAIAQAVQGAKYVDAGCTAPDGSVWLGISRRDWKGDNLAHVLPDGRIATCSTGELWWDASRLAHFPHGALPARDGALWLAIRNSGIACIRDGKARLYDWQEGVVATCFLWLFEAPDGGLYAASAPLSVYRWQPEGTPDRRLTEQWEQASTPSWRTGPLVGPSGNLWMFRVDGRRAVSRWDGTAWRHFAAPFNVSTVRHTAIDDRGHFIVEMHDRIGATYVLGLGGVRRYKKLEQAWVALVQDGSRKFESRHFVGPFVPGGGDIWYVRKDSWTVNAYLDGRWERFNLRRLGIPGNVRSMGLDEQGRMVFLTSAAMCRYEKGRLVAVAEAQRGRTGTTRLLLLWRRGNEVPYLPDIPKCLRAECTLLVRTPRNRFLPIRWEDRATFDAPRLSRTDSRKRTISSPYWAISAPGGGAWLRANNSAIYRWLDHLLVQITAPRTPVAHRVWDGAGTTASGGLWIMGGYHAGGRRVFFRKARPKDAQPTVRLKHCDVKYGRRIRLTWDLPAKGAIAVVWKTNLDGRWRPLREPTYERLFTQPGIHELTVEARAMDELGLLGPPTVRTFRLNVRLPRTRWTAKLPESLEDLVWVVPVDAEWTAPGVPGRIEWRTPGQAWRPLPANRRLPVAQYNNKGMQFQFRAVEEDVFVDPKPLSIKVPVEMALEEVIRPRIDLILAGTEAQCAQAIEDLKAAPEAARKLLRERLHSLRKTERRWYRALAEIEEAARQHKRR